MNSKSGLGRQLLISGGIVVVVAVIGAVVLRPQHEAPAAAAPSGEVTAVSDSGAKILKLETALAMSKTVATDLIATGLVSYPADETVKISPRVSGRIRQVYVRVGERVQTGQLLATLESADAAAALATLLQTENKMKLAKAVLDRQERLFKQGTSDVTAALAALDQARALVLAKKDLLARLKEQAQIGGFTQKPVEDAKNAIVQAKSALAQAQSDLAQAERDHTRKEKLVAIGIAARSDLEQSTNVLEKARIGVDADKEALVLAQQQLDREQKAFKTNLYADQAVRSGQSDYDQAVLQQQAAEKVLLLARTSKIQNLEQAKSDYMAAKTDYENARIALALNGRPDPDGTLRIVAPSSGLLIERDVNPGQVVDQSQETPWQMFVISDSKTVWVEADVYEKDLVGVKVGQPVRIRVEALPGCSYQGVVEQIAPVVDPKSRAVKVRAVLPNPGGALKDGMFATMTLLTPRGRAVTVVPLSAIQHDGDNDYVYIEEKISGHTDGEKKSFRRRTVHLGKSYGQDIVITDGLKPGEHVVTHGALFLGDQVNGG